MFDHIDTLPRTIKRGLLVLIDGAAVLIAVWAAFAIRLGDWWPWMLHRVMWLFPTALLISLPIFVVAGFYRSVLRYAGRDMLYTIAKGASFSTLLTLACWVLLRGVTVPRSAWFIYWLVLVALCGGVRLALRDYLQSRLANSPAGKRVIIYGAGVAGVQLAMALQHDPKFTPVAFVDDSREIQGSTIQGLRVYAPAQLSDLVRRKRVETVLLAIPSATKRRRGDILQALASTSVQVLVMPSLAELASGTRRIDELRQVEIEDVLGRDPVKPDARLLDACIRGKAVLVTGAGGSIGSELCRQILPLRPSRLILFEFSEYALYNIERELRKFCDSLADPPALIPILGSVTERRRVQTVLEAFAVQTVYHAAAYKHVPIVECNPIEGVHNNIFGTLHCAEAALAAGVETFVLISTDKAVRPTNVMGATKRFAELVLQGLAQQPSGTRFCMVRFGNVLASSGSVVPLFREQIRQGGPVTVTHPDATRYFMTIPEAAQLVIQAGSMAEDGEVLLLNMGEPVNIAQLARRMIELSGFSVRDRLDPDGDIEIQFTGLRPGEKLYEELLISAHDAPTSHPMIMRAREESLPWPAVRQYLARLERASKVLNYEDIRAVLLEAVQGYQPGTGIEDWVWLAHAGHAAQETSSTEPLARVVRYQD